MRIIADTHTHTLATDHAYSTITENALGAKSKKIDFLCFTEHTPAMIGAPSYLHFSCLKNLPRYLHGVMIIRGAEVNILDKHGTLDLEDIWLENLEWVVASMHTICYTPESKKEHTQSWLEIAENPLVDVIGHCGDERFDFDYKTVIKSFAKNNKIVEINSHSPDVRPGSAKNCRKIAKLCAEYGVPVVVSSDAHFHTDIGKFDYSLKMLSDIDFPQELVLNANKDRFLDTLEKINKKSFRNT